MRAYGASLQAALEKSDAGALALLQQTTQQQLLTDGNDSLDWQVQQAQSNIDALNQTLALAQQKYNFQLLLRSSRTQASRRERPISTLLLGLDRVAWRANSEADSASRIHGLRRMRAGVRGIRRSPTLR